MEVGAGIETELARLEEEYQRRIEQLGRVAPVDLQAALDEESLRQALEELERYLETAPQRSYGITVHIQTRRERLRDQLESLRTDFEDILEVRPNYLDNIEQAVERAIRVGRRGDGSAVRFAFQGLANLREHLEEERIRLQQQADRSQGVSLHVQLRREQLSEQLEEIRDQFEDTIQFRPRILDNLEALVQRAQQLGTSGDASAIRLVTAEFDRIRAQLTALQRTDAIRRAQVSQVQQRNINFNEELENIRNEFEEVINARPNILANLERTIRRAQQVGLSVNQQAIRDAIQELDSIREQLSRISEQDARRRAEVLQIQRRNEAQLLNEHAAISARNASRLERFNDLQSRFREAFEQIGPEGIESLLTDADFDALEVQLQRLQSQIQLNEYAMRRLLTLGGDFFKELIAGGREGEAVFERLQRVANRFLQEILDLILQATLLRPILERLLEFAPSIGQLLGGGQFGTPTNPTGNPAQSGGLRQGFTLVGESGPEIVDFRSASRVYSNDQLASILGGARGSVVINFNPTIQSTDGPGVRAALQEALPVYEQVVRNNLTRDFNRPSVMRQQLRNA